MTQDPRQIYAIFFKKNYKLFLWVADIREIYVELFTNVKLFANLQMEEQRAERKNREQVLSSSGRTRERKQRAEKEAGARLLAARRGGGEVMPR